MRVARSAIDDGTFMQFRKDFVENYQVRVEAIPRLQISPNRAQ
jgi:queuine/archaeosine tRNA-ribosyltransferase